MLRVEYFVSDVCVHWAVSVYADDDSGNRQPICSARAPVYCVAAAANLRYVGVSCLLACWPTERCAVVRIRPIWARTCRFFLIIVWLLTAYSCLDSFSAGKYRFRSAASSDIGFMWQKSTLIERVNVNQFLFTNSPLCVNVLCNAFLFYCRHIFLSIALGKSLFYLLGRIVHWCIVMCVLRLPELY